jgi:hypothetical protein
MIYLVFLFLFTYRINCLVIQPGFQKCSTSCFKLCSDICKMSKKPVSYCFIDSKWLLNKLIDDSLPFSISGDYFEKTCINFESCKPEDKHGKEDQDFFRRPRHLIPKFRRRETNNSDISIKPDNFVSNLSKNWNLNKNEEKLNQQMQITISNKKLPSLSKDDELGYLKCKCQEKV